MRLRGEDRLAYRAREPWTVLSNYVESVRLDDMSHSEGPTGPIEGCLDTTEPLLLHLALLLRF